MYVAIRYILENLNISHWYTSNNNYISELYKLCMQACMTITTMNTWLLCTYVCYDNIQYIHTYVHNYNASIGYLRMNRITDYINNHCQDKWYIFEAVGCYCRHSRAYAKIIWEIQANSTADVT